MAGKKVLVIKDVGGGLRGSTSGLLFNPRDAPEFVEEDRTYARGDEPEKKVLEAEEKAREKEKRHKQIAGLQHISLRAKTKRRAQGDDARDDEELSELTGGGSTMGGPNFMTSHDTLSAYEALLKTVPDRRKESQPLRLPPPFTDTMGQPGMKTERRKDETTEEAKFRRDPKKRKGKLRVFGRRPERHSKISGLAKRIVTAVSRAGGFLFPRLTQTRFRQTGTPRVSWNPRRRNMSIFEQQAQRRIPVSEINPTVPYQDGERVKNLNHSGRGPTLMRHKKSLFQPRQPGVALGSGHSKETSLAGGGASPTSSMFGQLPHIFTGGGRRQSTSVMTSMDYLAKAQLSQSDISEFKWLVRQLRHLLSRGILSKAGFEDAEHDDERPSPNAHRKTTSHPTGATSVDPDDDPRYWGAHPIGLLVARRGHM